MLNEFVCIGTDIHVECDQIAMVAALANLSDKALLRNAYYEQKTLSVRSSSQAKTAVVLKDGTVVLTPVTVKTVLDRIHAAMPFGFMI